MLCRFPEGFLWGAGTSAHQVEGGNLWNDWSRFERLPGKIRDGRASGDACRHYQLFDQDFALAAADGHRMHRLSLEWSRIEPERGRIDPGAVAHYHEVLGALRRRGLEPLVTLHHFTNPLWIADRGGWENRDTIERFTGFAAFCAREFGAEVDWWCTVNEPEVLGFRGWSEIGPRRLGEPRHHRALHRVRRLLRARVRRRGRLVVHGERARGAGLPRLVRDRTAAAGRTATPSSASPGSPPSARASSAPRSTGGAR